MSTRYSLEHLLDERQRQTTARMRAIWSDAGIGSSAALHVHLAALYGSDAHGLAHARRVASMSVFVASFLGFDEQLVGHIERAALLHDVGTLPVLGGRPSPGIVPAEIGRAQIVARHLLAAVPFLLPAAAFVAAVQERYDGSGCPNGLRDEAIPVGARIVAIADAFDTLIFPRDAASAVSVRVANARLVCEAGYGFDPVLVRGWLRALDCLSDDAHDARVWDVMSRSAPTSGRSRLERDADRTNRFAASRERVAKRRVPCS